MEEENRLVIQTAGQSRGGGGSEICPRQGASRLQGALLETLYSVDVDLMRSVEIDLCPASELEAASAKVREWASGWEVPLPPWVEQLAILILTTFQMRPTTVSH